MRSGILKRGAATLLAWFAGVAIGACSLFVSTDDLTPSAATDAGADTSNDAPVFDASGDGASDAQPADFCVTHASDLFCDDFDHGPIGATWDSKALTGGTLALDPTTFRSPPFSAAMTSDGNASAASLTRSIAASAGDYRIAFSLRVETPPAAGGAFQILTNFSNGNGAQLELLEYSNAFSINDRINGTYGTYYAGVPNVTVGAWQDFVVHLHFAASGGTSSASIDIDGTNVVPSFTINSAFNGPSAVGLTIGIGYGAGSSTAVSFDNAEIAVDN